MENTISVFFSNILDAVNQDNISLSEAIRTVKSAEIKALDFDFEQLKNGLPDEITQAGMIINSIYRFIDFSQEDALQKGTGLIDTAQKYNAIAMLVPNKFDEESIGILKSKKGYTDIFNALDRLPSAVMIADKIKRLSEYGRQKSVKVCVENFDSHRSLTERECELAWLFSKAPLLQFNLDTGNSVTCGENITDLYDSFNSRIVNVHCKDRVITDIGFGVTAVGEGQMPIKEIANALIEKGYTGSFSIEVFGVENPLEAILKSAKNLDEMFYGSAGQ